MFSVRKVKTGSGATAVQVVTYHGKRAKLIKHIGSARIDGELSALVHHARNYISERTGQATLFPEASSRILFVDRAKHIGVTHTFARNFLLACAHVCGLARLPALLHDLAMMRLIEPASKLRTLKLLKEYFGITYSQRVYRKIPLLIKHKATIEQIAFQCVRETLAEQCYLVLYDVTTLYFETHQEDTLRVLGFSKDDKSKQPQIVVGLLVSPSGFPLAHEVFPGNTFEGNTMLAVLKEFVSVHQIPTPVVVADAAMLSEKNIEQLKGEKISYIVGARLANTSKELIQHISRALDHDEKTIIRLAAKHGDLVCSFSNARYRKQKREMEQQIEKAKQLIANQQSGHRAKFVKYLDKGTVALHQELVSKTVLLLGIKGYCTNIPESILSNTQVIERYHDLWRIEQSFRMSKSDLQTRPIFHRKQDTIRSHVLICFVSLMMEKYLELSTGLSLRTIRDTIWNVTETHLQDTLTNETFVFRSSTDAVMKSPLGYLVKQWGLPH